MTRIRLNGYKVLLVLLMACGNAETRVEFSTAQPTGETFMNPLYSEYCGMNTTGGYEQNAVLSSFVGEHKTALKMAALDASRFATIPDDLSITKMFKNLEVKDARNTIIERAGNFHFVLINEAHYSGQHRAFTRSLLKPLWDKGFRYLALEALGYEDDKLNQRGYPLLHTGYYIKETTFGNLVREALSLGYTLVPYETTSGYDGRLRDREQAENIVANTLEKDSIGKVLVHAGYDHIFDFQTRSFQPMGSQIKVLTGSDPLSVDQQTMTPVKGKGNHPFANHVQDYFAPKKPVVLMDAEGQVLVDPVHNLGIDIQVYHPATSFVNKRPHWLLEKTNRLINLPDDILKYTGHQIQALKEGEDSEAVPVDQFVIEEGKALLLPMGNYKLRIVDCSGNVKAVFYVKVV